MLRISWDELEQLKGGGTVTLTRRRGSNLHAIYRLSRGKPVKCRVCSGYECRDRYTAVLSVTRVKRSVSGSLDYFYIAVIYKLLGGDEFDGA